MTNYGGVALRNLNETTRKYKRWVDRWYYGLGSLECRECNNSIVDKRDVCLYDGKIMHVTCMYERLDYLIQMESYKKHEAERLLSNPAR